MQMVEEEEMMVLAQVLLLYMDLIQLVHMLIAGQMGQDIFTLNGKVVVLQILLRIVQVLQT